MISERGVGVVYRTKRTGPNTEPLDRNGRLEMGR